MLSTLAVGLGGGRLVGVAEGVELAVEVQAAPGDPACPPEVLGFKLNPTDFEGRPPEVFQTGSTGYRLSCSYDDPATRISTRRDVWLTLIWDTDARSRDWCLDSDWINVAKSFEIQAHPKEEFGQDHPDWPRRISGQYNAQVRVDAHRGTDRGAWLSLSEEHRQLLTPPEIFPLLEGSDSPAAQLLEQVEDLAGSCKPADELEPEPEKPPAETCALHGVATDALGRPIANARVTLAYGTAPEKSAETDDTGRYDLGGLSPIDGQFDPDTDSVQITLYLQEVDPFRIFEEQGDDLWRFQISYRTRSYVARDPSERIRGDLTHIASVSTDRFNVAGLVGDECRRDFRAAGISPGYVANKPPALSQWPQAAQLYVDTQLAFTVAESLHPGGVAYGLPLDVIGWCEDAALGCPGPGAFATITTIGDRCTGGSRENFDPYLALDAAHTESRTGRHFYTLFHEFGHYFQTAMAGGVWPDVTCKTLGGNHGGYFSNSGSSDSWTEGFPHFFAYLVQKRLGAVTPQIYRSAKQLVRNMELDHKAWDWIGNENSEEWAVAGVLIDLVDGPSDYPQGRSVDGVGTRKDIVETTRLSNDQQSVVGEVFNDSGSTQSVAVVVEFTGATPGARDAVLDVEGTSDSGNRVRIPAGGKASFTYPIPPALRGLQFLATPLIDGGRVSQDDDGFAESPADVFNALRGYVPTATGATPRPTPGCPAPPREQRDLTAADYPLVLNVSELYDALQTKFGTTAARAQALDDLFINHGLFADDGGGLRSTASGDWEPVDDTLAGNKRHDPCEEVGLTSHPAMYPRFEVSPAPETRFALDAGEVDARVLVYVDLPEPLGHQSFGYIQERADDGLFTAAYPAAETGATVTVLALADGFDPTLVSQMTAGEFQGAASENPGTSFLSYSVQFEADDLASPRSDRSERPAELLAVAAMLIVGGLLLIAGGLWPLRIPRTRAGSS